MNNAIEVSGLCKAYKDFSLHDVSFTVPQGSIMGFVGENGAGKTTTLKAILGLMRFDTGFVRVQGLDPALKRSEIAQSTGVVLDGGFFYSSFTTKNINSVMRELHPKWNETLFEQYCKRFGLSSGKQIKEFSRGMRAKLSLIIALAHEPKLLVLDEATSGLDPVVRNEILDLFLEFIEDETHTILLSSHITSDLEKVADYITYIEAGKIAFSLSTEQIKERYAVIKCTLQEAQGITGAHILGRRDTHFGSELLVDNRQELARRYPQLIMEKASIDEIMTFMAKEEHAC